MNKRLTPFLLGLAFALTGTAQPLPDTNHWWTFTVQQSATGAVFEVITVTNNNPQPCPGEQQPKTFLSWSDQVPGPYRIYEYWRSYTNAGSLSITRTTNNYADIKLIYPVDRLCPDTNHWWMIDVWRTNSGIATNVGQFCITNDATPPSHTNPPLTGLLHFPAAVGEWYWLFEYYKTAVGDSDYTTNFFEPAEDTNFSATIPLIFPPSFGAIITTNWALNYLKIFATNFMNVDAFNGFETNSYHLIYTNYNLIWWPWLGAMQQNPQFYFEGFGLFPGRTRSGVGIWRVYYSYTTTNYLRDVPPPGPPPITSETLTNIVTDFIEP